MGNDLDTRSSMSETATEPDAGEATATTGAPSSEPSIGPNGFPEKTPWREMTPDQQVKYWQHQAQGHEAGKRAARAERDQFKSKADQYDTLDHASKSEVERERDTFRSQVEALQQQATQARAALLDQTLAARLAAAAPAKGLTAEQLVTLAGGGGRFAKDGDLDTEAVDTFLAALPDATPAAPAVPAPLAPGALGGGTRAKGPAMSGAELYEQRHGIKQAATT
jgi:hypothetical protein